MKPQDIGMILMILAPLSVADSYGQRFDSTYPHILAYAITAVLVFGGFLLINMKGNKK